MNVMCTNCRGTGTVAAPAGTTMGLPTRPLDSFPRSREQALAATADEGETERVACPVCFPSRPPLTSGGDT